MSLQDLPGYLGWTSKGVVAMNANWPVYPREHGADIALTALGLYPAGTTFRCLNNIDLCTLFVVDEESDHAEMSENRFHVAIWHEDLLALVETGLIDGIKIDHDTLPQEIWRRQTLGEKSYALYKSGATMGFMRDGEFHPLGDPPVPQDHEMLEDDEDDDHLAATARLAVYEGSTISLTAEGLAELDRIARQRLFVPPPIQSRILPLLAEAMFDTAIRELGVMIESRLRGVTGPGQWGMALVGRYITALQADGTFINASLKGLRAELRTAIKFVRNEFAHHVIDLPAARGYSLIGRLCAVIAELDEIAGILAVGQVSETENTMSPDTSEPSAETVPSGDPAASPGTPPTQKPTRPGRVPIDADLVNGSPPPGKPSQHAPSPSARDTD